MPVVRTDWSRDGLVTALVDYGDRVVASMRAAPTSTGLALQADVGCRRKAPLRRLGRHITNFSVNNSGTMPRSWRCASDQTHVTAAQY
jgi:hypothetical protein